MQRQSSDPPQPKKQARSRDAAPCSASVRINVYQAAGGQRRVDQAAIRRLVRRVLKAEKMELEALNIVLADDPYLRRLNERFFGKKRGTNVIAFDLGGIAEIYVSQDRARDVFDLRYYIIHGLLHVAGYEHREGKESARMRKKCLEYSNYG